MVVDLPGNEHLRLAHRRAVERCGQVHAIDVDPSGLTWRRTLGQLSWHSRRDCASISIGHRDSTAFPETWR
jgi:hypothetical protein